MLHAAACADVALTNAVEPNNPISRFLRNDVKVASPSCAQIHAVYSNNKGYACQVKFNVIKTGCVGITAPTGSHSPVQILLWVILAAFGLGQSQCLEQRSQQFSVATPTPDRAPVDRFADLYCASRPHRSRVRPEGEAGVVPF